MRNVQLLLLAVALLIAMASVISSSAVLRVEALRHAVGVSS